MFKSTNVENVQWIYKYGNKMLFKIKSMVYFLIKLIFKRLSISVYLTYSYPLANREGLNNKISICICSNMPTKTKSVPQKIMEIKISSIQRY